jgi:hypothetical protein
LGKLAFEEEFMTDASFTGDEHPEELLDLAGRGAMSDSQWRALREHIAVCLPCATQERMSMRAAAESAVAGTISPSRVHRDRLALNRALERSRLSRRARRAWLVPRARRWISVGVGTVLLSSAALAATWWSTRHIAAVSVLARPAQVATASVSEFHPRLLRPVDSLPQRDEPSSEPTPGDRGASLASARGRGDRATAAELFAHARALRLNGNQEGALAIYRRLQRGYGDSREGRLSYLVVGRLWLERGRPDLAAPQFSRYLDTAGSASEEALVGRATAFGRMGRASEEVTDWRTLVSEHPQSVYLNRARSRLEELDRPAGTPGSATVRQ